MFLCPCPGNPPMPHLVAVRVPDLARWFWWTLPPTPFTLHPKGGHEGSFFFFFFNWDWPDILVLFISKGCSCFFISKCMEDLKSPLGSLHWLSCHHAESLHEHSVLWLKPHSPLGSCSVNCSKGNRMFLRYCKPRAWLDSRQHVHVAWALGWGLGDCMVAKSATGLLAGCRHLSELRFLSI